MYLWCLSDPRFIQFALVDQLLRCAHKRIVIINKVYIERNNMQVGLKQFRKKYRHYLRLLLRTEEFNATRVFTLVTSLQHSLRLFDSNHFNYPRHVATVPWTKPARKVVPTCACSICARSTIMCYSSLRFWLSRSTRDREWTHVYNYKLEEVMLLTLYFVLRFRDGSAAARMYAGTAARMYAGTVICRHSSRGKKVDCF